MKKQDVKKARNVFANLLRQNVLEAWDELDEVVGRSPKDIGKKLNIQYSEASAALKKLRDCGLVRIEEVGRHRFYYRMNDREQELLGIMYKLIHGSETKVERIQL